MATVALVFAVAILAARIALAQEVAGQQGEPPTAAALAAAQGQGIGADLCHHD